MRARSAQAAFGLFTQTDGDQQRVNMSGQHVRFEMQIEVTVTGCQTNRKNTHLTFKKY